MKDELVAALGAAMLVAALAFIAAVLSVMWSLFVVPLGVPELSISHAAGVSLIALMMQSGSRRMPYESDEHYGRFLLKLLFLRPSLVLAFGFVIHWAGQ